MAFHARKASSGQMLVIPRLKVRDYLDLCDASHRSVIDFCRTVMDFFPASEEFSNADSMDIFYLLLAARIHFISPTIKFATDEKSNTNISLEQWFENGKDNVFDCSLPRTKNIETEGVRVMVGLPRFGDIYDFHLWYSTHADFNQTGFARDVDQDFLATVCYIREIEIGGTIFDDSENIHIFLENVENDTFRQIRHEIQEMSMDFSVVLTHIDSKPLILNPLNAMETARMMFSENPDHVLNSAYVIGKYTSIDPFELDPGQMERMMELLLDDKKAENNQVSTE